MSVIVLGMEMPKNCKQCLFSRYILGEYFCRTTTTLDEDGEEMWESVGRFGFMRRLDCCPLRPLPEKHGRLIDADAMERVMSETVQGDIRGYPYSDTQWEMAFRWIDHQPTIAESEGERNEQGNFVSRQAD